MDSSFDFQKISLGFATFLTHEAVLATQDIDYIGSNEPKTTKTQNNGQTPKIEGLLVYFCMCPITKSNVLIPRWYSVLLHYLGVTLCL